MKLRLIALPILAVGGFALTAVAVARFNMPPKTGPAPIAPPAIPFEDRVAGVGIVEPASETIQVGAQIGGVVTRVFVTEGQRVAAGDPLIETDPREADARLETARASLAAAQAQVSAAQARAATAQARVMQLEARPRSEDLAEAAAIVDARRAAVVDAEGRLERLLRVSDRGTAANELPTLEANLAIARAQLAQAEESLARVKVGTYPEDLAVAGGEARAAAANVDTARAQLLSAEAAVRETEVARELLVVRAPIAGTVLKLDAHVGEYKAGVRTQRHSCDLATSTRFMSAPISTNSIVGASTRLALQSPRSAAEAACRRDYASCASSPMFNRRRHSPARTRSESIRA